MPKGGARLPEISAKPAFRLQPCSIELLGPMENATSIEQAGSPQHGLILRQLMLRSETG